MDANHATRQHWMSVLAHCDPASLEAKMVALNITAQYEVIRAAETGLVQLQGRMGATGERFFAGDATLVQRVPLNCIVTPPSPTAHTSLSLLPQVAHNVLVVGTAIRCQVLPFQ